MNQAHLFHASEEHDIPIFRPRPAPDPTAGPDYPCVWAIAHSHVANYFSPRDCPRVIVRRGPKTTEADAAQFLGQSACVMTIERDWADRLAATPITLYAFALEPHWRLWDANAQQFVSPETVTPIARHHIPNPAAALRERSVDVRLVDDLWPLIDAVAASSIAFSVIRKRNAKPRLAP